MAKLLFQGCIFDDSYLKTLAFGSGEVQFELLMECISGNSGVTGVLARPVVQWPGKTVC
ncbi:MAG: hypothetical protein WBW01_09445 [Terriglobales bacterium]